MGYVTSLSVSEPVRVDVRRVRDIIDELGEGAAQSVIGLALEQLATTLTATDNALSSGDHARAIGCAEQLSRLAWQIGLPSLTEVAQDLGHCIERRDTAALAAVQARMMRVGNYSLTKIWDRAPLG